MINERIKEFRTQMHLSQEYVAQYLGVNRATFSLIENGKRKVLAEEIDKLSTLFGVSADLLLRGKDIEMPEKVFARSFEQLDEIDKAEILNLIKFKEQMKAQKGR